MTSKKSFRIVLSLFFVLNVGESFKSLQMIISLETNENVEAMFLLCKYPLIILLYRSRHEPRATPSKEVAGSSNHRQPLSGKNFSWLNITWQVLLTQWLLFNFVKYVNQKPLKLSTFFISIKVMKNIGFPSKRNRIMSFTWLLFVSIINQSYMRTAVETLEELDWCLDQLETMQTHRSVSDMASNKVSITNKQKHLRGWTNKSFVMKV